MFETSTDLPRKTTRSLAVSFAILFSGSVLAGPFEKGSSSLLISAGSVSAFDDDYFILGLGYGYFVLDGLQLGIDIESWLGGDPSVYQLTPQVQYVFHQVPKVQPYLGAFYTRSYIEGFDDLDAFGYRAGLYFAVGGNSRIGIGGARREYQDCKETVYTDCSSSFTELTFLITL